MVKAHAQSTNAAAANAARPPAKPIASTAAGSSISSAGPQPVAVDVVKVERRAAARSIARLNLDLIYEEAKQFGTEDEKLAFWSLIRDAACERTGTIAVAATAATLAAVERAKAAGVDPAAVAINGAAAKIERACRRSLPPDQRGLPRGLPNESDEVSEALDIADECMSMIDDLPTRGQEFGESVCERVRGIVETIEESGRVTEKQREALENMRDGLSRWMH